MEERGLKDHVEMAAQAQLTGDLSGVDGIKTDAS